MEAEWRALWDSDRAATPFEAPEWLAPWTRHLWNGGRLRMLAVRNGGELTGLAPLFFWGYPEAVRVSWLGSGISDHLGMLAAPGCEEPAAGAVLGWLAERRDEWDECDLREMRPACTLLRVAPPAGLIAHEGPCGVCPVLEGPPRTEPKFRHNLRTAENRLRREGTVEIVEGPDLLGDLFRLHKLRWGEAGLLSGERLQQFHRNAAGRLAARGMLRIYGLRLNGETIAVQYNFRRGGRYFYYLSGFDPAWARCSPGAVLLAETIRRAMAEGAEEIDFLRKGEAFKYQWGAHDRENRRLEIRHA